MTLSGDLEETVFSDVDGNYVFPDLPMELNYTVSISKPKLSAQSGRIDTTDVIAIQRHFLGLGDLPDCEMLVADVNRDNAINTIDISAVQRFSLGIPAGTAHTGEFYVFPNTRVYIGVASDQANQNYLAMPFGDVVGKNQVEKDTNRH